MRSSSSRWSDRRAAAAIALASIAALSPRAASAQACCTGGSALSPARLAMHEKALVGVRVEATAIAGSFDAARRFVPSPGDSSEFDFEEDLALALRLFGKGQVSALVPLRESVRSVPGLSEAGAGIGDVQAAFRWDFTTAGGPLAEPGLALSAGATFPTGRPPESSDKPLATDASGTGAFEGSLAMAIEQQYRSYLFNVSGTLGVRSPRTVGDVHQQQGPRLNAFAAAGYSFENGALLALTASYTYEFETWINGAMVQGSARAFTRAGLAGGMLLPSSFRLQGTLFGDLPIRFLGQNQPVGAGLSVMIIRGFS